MSSTNGDRFPLGKLYMTPGIQVLLEEAECEPFTFVARNASGDWGEVCEEDAEANGSLRPTRSYAEALGGR